MNSEIWGLCYRQGRRVGKDREAGTGLAVQRQDELGGWVTAGWGAKGPVPRVC